MTGFKDMGERELEGLLVGRAPTGDDGLQGIADFVRDLKAGYPEEPVPGPVEAEHLAAMIATAELLAVSDDPARRRAGNAQGRRRPTWGLPMWSRLAAYRRLPRVHPAAKLAIASAALLMLFCGLALAGTLPGPVQGFASRAASAIGVHIANPDAKATTPATGVASPTAKPSPGKAAGAADSHGQQSHRDQGAGQQQNQNQSGGQGQQQTPGQGDGQHQTQGQGGGQDQSQSQGQSQPQQQTQSQDQSGSND